MNINNDNSGIVPPWLRGEHVQEDDTTGGHHDGADYRLIWSHSPARTGTPTHRRGLQEAIEGNKALC